MSKSVGYAFRQASRSTADGRHDHGIDVGARRNHEQEKLNKKQAEDSKKTKEKEIARRKSMQEEVIRKPRTTKEKMEIFYKILESLKEEKKKKEGYQNWPGEKKKPFFRNKDMEDETKKWKERKNKERAEKALKEEDDKKDPKKIVGGKTKVDVRPKTNSDVDAKGNPIKSPNKNSDIQEELLESLYLKKYKRQNINSKDYHFFTHENGSSLLINKIGDNFNIVHKDKNDIMTHFKDVESLSKHINNLHKSEDDRDINPDKKNKKYLRKKSSHKPKSKPPIAAGWTSTKGN